MTRLVSASALLLALAPISVQAQETVGWLDLLDPTQLAQRALQIGVFGLRSQADVKYGDMTVDLRNARVSMTDIQVWPMPPWDDAGECMVSLNRLDVKSVPLSQPDKLQLRVQALGLEVSGVCLPPDARQPLAMAGLSDLAVPRLTFDVNYDVPSAEATLHVYSEVTGIGAASLDADFSYVGLDARDRGRDPQPVVYLNAATLTLEDLGIWAGLQGMMPGEFTDPAIAAGVIGGVVSGALSEMNSGNGGPGELTAAQLSFVNSASAVWPAFLRAPQKLVVETDLGPGNDVYVDFVAYQDSPWLIFEDLQPVVSLAPVRSRAALPVALLIAALGDGLDGLSRDDRCRAGIALFTGVGAPRNRAAGEALLAPMARGGNAEAAQVLSEAMETARPVEAYRFAMVAAAGGMPGATARLDRLEGVISFAQVLQLQQEVVGPVNHPVEALQSVAAMRTQASERFEGRKQLRSYGVAAIWAILGAAAGDSESADILALIDEKVAAGGAEAASAWAAVEANASDLTMNAWITEDLPGRFGGR